MKTLLTVKSIQTLLFLVGVISFLSCNQKKSFLSRYKEFKITIREPEELRIEDRSLTDSEKIILINLLNNNDIAYKDTLNSIYISNKEFYDDPKLFFWSYSEMLFDTIRQTHSGS